MLGSDGCVREESSGTAALASHFTCASSWNGLLWSCMASGLSLYSLLGNMVTGIPWGPNLKERGGKKRKINVLREFLLRLSQSI